MRGNGRGEGSGGFIVCGLYCLRLLRLSILVNDVSVNNVIMNEDKSYFIFV